MRSARFSLRQFPFLILFFFVGLALLIWQAGLNTSRGDTAPSAAESMAAWDKVATVVQHPRCLNCHQVNSPRQGDEQRLHVPLVVRGEDNLGATGMRCTNCHSQTGNNPTTGVPGAPHWSMAPLEQNWQGLSSGDICRQVRDPARNGNRNAEQLVSHFTEDHLVGWGWNPGPGRQPVPLTRAELTEHLTTWLAGGSECPQ